MMLKLAKSPIPRGFTLIELVTVIILLSILAAVAIPRFVGMTQQAHHVNVAGTTGAMASAVAMSHAKWLAMGQPKFDTVTGIGFNAQGWPNAANRTLSEISQADVLGTVGDNDMICAQIMLNILGGSQVNIAAGHSCAQEYCAVFQAPDCVYIYQKNNQHYTIVYSPMKGTVLEQSKMPQ